MGINTMYYENVGFFDLFNTAIRKFRITHVALLIFLSDNMTLEFGEKA